MEIDQKRLALQKRPTAEHILIVLKEHKANGGTGMRFKDIKLELLRHGWVHVDCAISQNNHWLVGHGFTVYNDPYYSIPDKEAKLDEQH